MPLPPTRILSWSQMVTEADPHWQQDYRKPWLYEFSNRRRFYATVPMYNFQRYLEDDQGRLVLDDRGNPIPIT